MESFIDLANILEKYIQTLINRSNHLSVADISQILTIILSSLITIFSLYLNRKQSRENHEINKNEKLIQLQQKKLEEFYYPLNILLKKDFSLFSLFALEEKKDPHFSTLLWLLNGHIFSDSDRKLLKEIIQVNHDLNDLIITKGGCVNDNKLRSELSQLSTHFTILNLAHEGLITEKKDKYEEIIFPDKISTSIENKIKEIEDTINSLSI